MPRQFSSPDYDTTALDALLAAVDPAPACALDRDWNVIVANFEQLVGLLLNGLADEAFRHPSLQPRIAALRASRLARCP